MKADHPKEAIEEFLGVPGLEPEKGDWGFKGLKQAIKLEYKMGMYDQVCPKCSLSNTVADHL